MASAKRVLVYLAEGNRLPQCARFVQSITGALSGCHADQVEVSCSLEGQHFVLSAGEREGASRVLLRRAPFCPFKRLSATEAASLPSDVQARGVDVGVAVLLQTADRKTLLTRRAAPLTIFPNIWVPPAAGRGAEGAGRGDGTVAGPGRVLLQAAGTVGVRVPTHADQGVATATPHRHLPAPAQLSHAPAAPGETEARTPGGQWLCVAGRCAGQGHRGLCGRGRRPGAAAGPPAPDSQGLGGVQRGGALQVHSVHSGAAEPGARAGRGPGAGQHRH
nr:PREDICTED: nucleoside diphosphate-linked moiety X motif 17 isoform X2 [Lepisosteus oculatus]